MSRQTFLGASLLLLLLVSAAVRADTYDVIGSFDQVGQTYDGYLVNLTTISQSPTQSVAAVLQDATVSGAGLDIYGFRTEPTTVANTLDLRILSPAVNDATITFEGFMPRNSKIQVNNTFATMQSSRPVFNLNFLDISSDTVFTLFSTLARWTGSQRGWVVSMQGNTAPNNIRSRSALFIMGVTARNAAGIFSTSSIASLTVNSYSVLAVDYSTCNGCSAGLISLGSPTNVQDGSMLRISHNNATDGNMIGIHNAVSITSNSLLLISDDVVSSGNLFSQQGGTLSVTSGARATLRNIKTPSTGLSSAQPIPTVTSPATSLGGNVVVAGAALQSIADYAARGLTITTLLTNDGYSSGTTTCASAACIPAGTSAAASSISQCPCVCADNSFNVPDCTKMYDPIVLFQQSHNDNCYVPNCAICSPTDPTICIQCASGYDVQSDGTCRKSGGGGGGCGCGACGIPGCSFCRWYPTRTCLFCGAGYRRNGPLRCVPVVSAAESKHTAPLAMAMLFLTAMAAHVA